MTFKIKAADFLSIHNIHRAALGCGLCYHEPYFANDVIIGAEGTQFMISRDTMVACTMASRNRMIIHTRIPCTNVDSIDGVLYAFEVPKEFDSVLRRFGDKQLVLTCDDNYLEIDLPRPQNMLGKVWVPMERVNGHMYSESCQEPTTTACMSADILISAMSRVPRGKYRDQLAILPSDEGLDFRYVVNSADAYERLPATIVNQSNTTTLFVCSTRCIAGYVRVLKRLPKNRRNVKIQISTSRFAIWNDNVTIQIFADRKTKDWKLPSTSDMNVDSAEIDLFLERCKADLPKRAGKWLRKLVRIALAGDEKTETTWILSRDLVVVNVDCGLKTSVEIPCTSESWAHDQDRVCLNIDPLTTATFLECFEEDTLGCHVAYRNGHLTFQTSSRSYQLTVRAELISSRKFEEDKIMGAFQC